MLPHPPGFGSPWGYALTLGPTNILTTVLSYLLVKNEADRLKTVDL